MNKFTRLLCFAVMALMCCVQSWAGTPTMNQPFEATDFQFNGWDNVTIPASYFLSDADEIQVTVKGASYVAFQVNNKDYKVYEWNDANKTGVIYTLDETSRVAALAGTLKVRVDAADATLTILNKDANYQEPSSGGGSGGGSTDGGNTGGGSSTKTLAEKIAAKEQLTDVPTLYFTISSIPEGADINTYLKKENNVAEYLDAQIQVVDKTEGGLTEFTDNVQIKVRGNSTAKETKKPYRLKFGKDEKDAAGNVTVKHKHDLLGKGYSKRNWALLANFIDPAMVRNALTYKVGELVDMPFKPGYKFADVVINGEYRGTYQITDHVEVGSNRIDIDEDTGWFLESARGDMVEQPSASAQSLFMSIKNPEPATDAETATLKSQIENWFKPVDALFCIYNGDFDLDAFTNPKTGWRKYWDEESLVNFYLGINITGDYDGFMTVKMYRDVNGKMKFGPIWDKDLAYGNWSADDGKKLAEDQQAGSYFSSYVKKLWLDPVFVKKVHDKMATLVANGLSTTLVNYVDALVSETAQTDALNHTKWSTSYSSWTLSFSSREAAVAQLKEYLSPHITWLKNTIDTQYEALGGDAIVDNTTGGDSGEGGESGGGSGTTEHAEPHEFTLGQWQNTLIPSDTFHQNATKATFTVTGASYIKLSDSQNEAISGYEYSWNDANQAGVTFDITGDVLTDAKANGLYINVGGGTNITLSITCTIPEGSGEGGGGDTPATRQQLTNLPTIYLDATVGDEWSTAALEVFDKDNKLTQGTTWTSSAVSVQYQGGHSEGTKDSYRLKFDSKTKLLSSGKFKQWVLASNDDDPSLINNALAKELGDLVGMPFTPGYQFVDLYLNNTYMGTYQVTDRIKTESGRALVTGGNKDSDWHVRINDGDEIDEGGYTTDEYVVATSTMPNLVIKNPDPDDLDATKLATLKNDMNTWFTTFFTKDANSHYSSVADNVDKQQIINWYICQEVLAIYKGLSSVEAYRSITATDQTLHFGPLWDNETAFGNRGDEDAALSMSDLKTAGSYNGLIFNYNKYGLMKSFIEDLWTQDWFKTGVPAKWNALVEDGLLNTLKDKASTISATLTQSQAKNLEKWTNSLKTKYNTYSSYSAAVDAISTYLDQRVPYLTKKFNALGTVCTTHTYNNEEYTKQEDGTYRRACDNCGLTEENGETYYQFTVFPESADKYTVTATSWQPSEDKPNSIATVKITPSGAEANINGYNIMNKTGNADGNNTCADFRLTDGHPYYSENKFVATKATYTRSIKNAWGTICLPFKMQSASTDYAKFYHLSEVKATNGEASTLVFVEIDPTVEGNSSAYIPVVFKATDKAMDESKIVVDGSNVTVKKITETKSNSTVEGWTLNGTVDKYVIDDVTTDQTLSGKSLYYISNNKFWLATKKYTNNPFRAYFVSDAPASTGSAKAFSINVADEQTTSVENVEDINSIAIFVENGGVSIYSPISTDINIYAANGSLVKVVSVSAGTTASVALTSGVYVINGVKFVIK